MFGWVIKKLLGTRNQRVLRRLQPIVERINEIEEELQGLTDEQLQAKTGEFRRRLAEGETVDDLLPEAFAVVKNACRRLQGRSWEVCGHEITWDMVPFDVQLIGAITLHQGNIAEMATGEGKTLVATMPLYLNALTGRNVHLVTVNDFLARRDSEWMGGVFRFLGLTVGCIQNEMGPEERRRQYACDITYGTNSEFGFDYLRDNGMATSAEQQVQRGHYYAIIDEVDSILIDEARTPLIISGPATVSTQRFDEIKKPVSALVRKQTLLCNDLVQKAKKILAEENGDEGEAARLLWQAQQGMPKNKQLLRLMEDPRVRRLLERIDGYLHSDTNKEELFALKEELYFVIDEKGHDADLTEKGRRTLDPNDPDAFVLPDITAELSEIDGDESLSPEERDRRRQEVQELFDRRSERIHNISQLLRAYCLYEKDVEYVVQDNRVIIVDEFTGRLMPGRRWSDGLHQAVEAKEGVKIERETQTLATITIQNYFRMYEKLAGMTGTAETEADEFAEIYKLDVTVIPTNRPVRRVDANDLIYKTRREKYNAIIEEIADCHRRRQPVLVGTVSVEASEVLSRMLKRMNIPHNVLNAKYHQQESEIIARAGQAGAVTIATNMAGRGTDIKLGPDVVKIPREWVLSDYTLDSKPDGKKTLREYLLENPCGLHVIGTERHESRRIDRQLRGRCARQGDPGSSRFYVSLEDDLMRLFGSGRISRIMEKLGMEEGEPLEHPLLNRSIESAQRKVEQHNFSIRKRTLEYDDVMNRQREVIYGLRNEILHTKEPRRILLETIEEAVRDRVEALFEGEEESRDVKGFLQWANLKFPIGLRAEDLEGDHSAEELTERIMERIRRAYSVKEQTEDPEALVELERYALLSAIDRLWQEHLYAMDGLRHGIGLRAYGQRDPLIEYKQEAYMMFEQLMDAVREEMITNAFRSASSLAAFEKFLSSLPRRTVHEQVTGFDTATAGSTTGSATVTGRSASRGRPVDAAAADAALAATYRRGERKVGRNEPCPCGSGKKYKHCCGR